MITKVLIAADIVPTKSNQIFFTNADIEYLVGKKLEERLKTADFITMNLEVPLVDSASPIRKCGPCLIAPVETIAGLKEINPYFFTLANNHILDQGISGLNSTIKVLKENGIAYAGVGNNIEEAKQPFIKVINNLNIGFYCCAEHEFSIAEKCKAGANPYDPLESFEDVSSLKDQCDYVIVLYHGGKENYRYPSPLLQKVFHKFADHGADLVVAQHTHCIGCKEEYHGSTLVYGQGNFLFDNSKSEFWKTALLIELVFEAEKQVTINYIPLVKENEKVRESEGCLKESILEAFQKRSHEILEMNFIEKEYDRFAIKMEKEYLLRFSGRLKRNIFVRILNKLTSYQFIQHFYPDDAKVAIENVLDCEAHRELAIRCMKEK